MIFEQIEYLERLRKTRERMAARGIDVLLLSDPGNINYLSGYDGWSFYVHQALLVAQDQEQPVWIGRGQDANAARVTTFLEPANIAPYPDDFVQSELKHPMDFVAGQLRARRWDRRRIGVEMDSFYFTAAAFEALRRSLPDTPLLDARALVNWVRIVKSEAEIALMRQAARIVEQAMQVAIDAVAPGVRQCDAVARIYEAQIRGTAEFGGTYPAIAPLLPTGTGTSTPHLTWDDAPFRPDTPTILELAGCRNRYHCPMARTVHLGPPPRRLADTAEVVVAVGAPCARNSPGESAPWALCLTTQAPSSGGTEQVNLIRIQQQGLGRPIISTNVNGYQIVAVGNAVYYSKNWQFFVDFLFDYVKQALGSDWHNEEIAKTLEERHPITQWYDSCCRLQQDHKKRQDGTYVATLTGVFACYLGLAYNLYLLKHNVELQTRLINRLKNREQFQEHTMN